MRLIRVAVCTFALLLTAASPARVEMRCDPFHFIQEWNGEDPKLATNWHLVWLSEPAPDGTPLSYKVPINRDCPAIAG